MTAYSLIGKLWSWTHPNCCPIQPLTTCKVLKENVYKTERVSQKQQTEYLEAFKKESSSLSFLCPKERVVTLAEEYQPQSAAMAVAMWQHDKCCSVSTTPPVSLEVCTLLQEHRGGAWRTRQGTPMRWPPQGQEAEEWKPTSRPKGVEN